MIVTPSKFQVIKLGAGKQCERLFVLDTNSNDI